MCEDHPWLEWPHDDCAGPGMVRADVEPPQCRFGDGEAAAHVSVPGGCVCYPDDREQDLCLQHLSRCTPLDGLKVLGTYGDLRLV